MADDKKKPQEEDIIKEVVEKEIDRMLKIPVTSPEANVSRTYIETMLSLPWTERTEEVFDLNEAAEILDEPILVPGKAGFIGDVCQSVAAGIGHLLPQFLRPRHLNVPELPVDFLALGVIGQNQIGIDVLGIASHRLAFQLV